jgi:hypothetical protein
VAGREKGAERVRRNSDDTEHRIARTIEANMLIAVMALPAALRQMHQCGAGYPSGQPGSGDGTSRTEALALASPDDARRDRDRTRDLLNKINPLSAELANIVARWHDGSTYSAKDLIQNRADDVWCRNCMSHGEMSPRKAEHANCSWCVAFHSAEGWWPSKPLVDLHKRGKVRQEDIDRHRPKGKRGAKAA